MPDPNRPPENPPETPPGGGGEFQEMMRRCFGGMEDDSSRRRGKRRRPKEDDDKLQIDSLIKKRPTTTFDDVAGNDEAKTELQEIARAIQEPDFYTKFGASLPRGILMTGKPGVGKTWMTGALANALNAPFYHVQVSQITSMWFGQSEKNLQKIFDHAKMYVDGEIEISDEGEVGKWDPDQWAADREAELLDEVADENEENPATEGRQNRREQRTRRRVAEIRAQIREEVKEQEERDEKRFAIIFFDEIDALGASRDNTPFQGGVSNRIVSVLLENLDGLESTANIIVVASTNRVEAVDPALRRAGRFDRIIKVKKPERKAREKMFEIHFGKAEERAKREFVRANFTELALATKGMVGADVAEIVRKACQDQAKAYREAEEEEREALDSLTTEDTLGVIKSYRTTLRDKDPYAKKGRLGFHNPKTEKADDFLVEEDLDDDDDDLETEE